MLALAVSLLLVDGLQHRTNFVLGQCSIDGTIEDTAFKLVIRREPHTITITNLKDCFQVFCGQCPLPIQCPDNIQEQTVVVLGRESTDHAPHQEGLNYREETFELLLLGWQQLVASE